ERHEGRGYPYAVTNRHLIDKGYRFLRLNTRENRLHIVPSEPETWRFHTDGDDVAVLSLDLDWVALRWFTIGTENFISREIMREYRLGPGDEVFLIGRMVTVEGRQRNTPVARFGNLSMMAHADEPIRRADGGEQESFIVECRSLSGFSGSPVFVATTQHYLADELPRVLESGEPVPTPDPEAGGIRVTRVGLSGTFGPWLLGIDWGHVPLWRPVYERGPLLNERHKTEDFEVDANTGMAYVLPAWRILELL